MRIATHENKLETSHVGESQSFGIGDPSVIIDMLRNRMYEHKIQTLVQEYICNGRDAMREVDNKGQLQVTAPTSLSPVFKVRDFGPGISPSRMANVFVKYGASTKRGTNNQTGGFGIGAKSAWSYTDSFTIVTHIDGVKRTYVAHTGVDNNGRLDHVDESTTDEANGTEIHVPVQRHDIGEFVTAIYRAIYFWENKPVIKGDVNPVPELISGLRLSANIEIVANNMLPSYVGGGRYSDGEMTAVIDGVPYPIGSALRDKANELQKLSALLRNGMKVVFHMNNGVVEVSPSRERIEVSKKSVSAMQKLAKDALRLVEEYLKSEWAKVTSTSEFFETYIRLSENFATDRHAKYGDYSINGGAVESELFSKVRITKIHNEGRYGRRSDKITKSELTYLRNLPLEAMQNMFYLEGEETLVKLNKRYREYFSKDMSKAGRLFLIEPRNSIVVTPAVSDKDGKVVTPAVMAPDLVSYNKLKADLNVQDVLALTWTEVPKEQRQPRVKRDKTEFCAHTPGCHERHTYINLETNERQWLYVTMKEKNSWPEGLDNESVRQLSRYLDEKSELVICGLNEKVAVKVQDDPNFSLLTDYLDQFKPSKEQVRLVKWYSAKNRRNMYLVAKLTGLEDDFLARMAQEYGEMISIKDADDKYKEIPSILVSKIKLSPEYLEFIKNDEVLETVLQDKYPLIANIRNDKYSPVEDTALAEIELYVNAKNKKAA